jgi:hypothetical protein
MGRERIYFTKTQHQWSTIQTLSMKEAKEETLSITPTILSLRLSRLRWLKWHSCNLIMNRYMLAVSSLHRATCMQMECHRTSTMSTSTNQLHHNIIKYRVHQVVNNFKILCQKVFLVPYNSNPICLRLHLIFNNLMHLTNPKEWCFLTILHHNLTLNNS